MGAAVAMSSVATALAGAIRRLAAAGVPEARADAEVLVAHALGTTRAGVIAAARDPLPPAVERRLAELVRRRAAREPVAHLVGEREFWSLPIAVDRRVLVPRPETELVVETALRVVPGARRVLDVGTGSGAIAVALARELPAAFVTAVDVDPGALAVARANCTRHAPGVRLVCADLVAPFRGAAFDLVVANPPYVVDVDIAALAPEVRDHEPRHALAGGADGLDVLRALASAVPRVLAPTGWLVVEIGAGQAAGAAAAFAADGWDCGETVRDAAGIERVLAVVRKEGRWTR